jgi:hypothetical protein
MIASQDKNDEESNLEKIEMTTKRTDNLFVAPIPVRSSVFAGATVAFIETFQTFITFKAAAIVS